MSIFNIQFVFLVKVLIFRGAHKGTISLTPRANSESERGKRAKILTLGVLTNDVILSPSKIRSQEPFHGGQIMEKQTKTRRASSRHGQQVFEVSMQEKKSTGSNGTSSLTR